MLNSVIAFSIRQRGLVIAAGLCLAIWGLHTVGQTPMDAVPDLSENQVIVFTEWPGHGPRELEDQVTSRLSRQFQSLAGLRAVRGSSDVGFSMIHLIFDDSVDSSTARTRVGRRLADVSGQLPDGIEPRVAPEAIPTGQIFWYTIEGAGYDLAKLRSLQDWYVRPQLEGVEGVAEVASVGGHVLEYVVELDIARMRDRRVEAADIEREIHRSNVSLGGDVIHQGNAEFVVRTDSRLGEQAMEPGERRAAVLSDLRQLLVPTADHQSVRLEEVATVRLGARPRRGILEKDGNEVAGGVVLVRHQENPLKVTRRLKAKVAELTPGLPAGVRIVPCYDRTPLIEGAVQTVTGTLIEAIVTATVCVLLILLHLRASFVIAITLPLAALMSFIGLWGLRRLGIADIQTNIMSLAGIAISIGVLVDSSIVMAENSMHRLREKFGDQPVSGDIRDVVLSACQMVGGPIFGSVLVMLLSFLPVFALGGIDGRMYRPLAVTKCLALASVACLAVTLVPALCTVLLKGRMRRETDSGIVRGVIEVYRPVLGYLLDQPLILVWTLSAMLVTATCALGERALTPAATALSVVATFYAARSRATRFMAPLLLLGLALVANRQVAPLAVELRMPLDEGMVMDMPITVPRASATQSGDDLKARNMLMCRFPEIDMVVGKAGRAETAFDPAPLDMIETMIMFRPPFCWPRRKIPRDVVLAQGGRVLQKLEAAQLLTPQADAAGRTARLEDVTAPTLRKYDAQQREFCHHRNQAFLRSLSLKVRERVLEAAARLLREHGTISTLPDAGTVALATRTAPPTLPPDLHVGLALEDARALWQHAVSQFTMSGNVPESAGGAPTQPGRRTTLLQALAEFAGVPFEGPAEQLQRVARNHVQEAWRDHVQDLDREIAQRAPVLLTRLLAEELLDRGELLDMQLTDDLERIDRLRQGLEAPATNSRSTGSHHGASRAALPVIDPHPRFEAALSEAAAELTPGLRLQVISREELGGSYDGELNQALQMPGWTNVWTMPIQNRVDMLATGVNSEIGVRVLGDDLDRIVDISEQIAAVLQELPGAVDVIADPLRGKGYLEIRPDRSRAAACGVSVGELNAVVELALGGRIVTETLEGSVRNAVRIRLDAGRTDDLEAIRRLPVPSRPLRVAARPPVAFGAGFPQDAPPRATETAFVPLGDVAQVGFVEGPATIKSEQGMLRNYVRLNVEGRDPLSFVEEARRIVASRVDLPEGTVVEWTGQYEHGAATRRRLWLLLPVVVGLIFLVLYATYRDLADALAVMLAVPGALAGGVLFQWLFGFPLSMAVGVGYIACFGMAAATGMIMLVYLREAVDNAGGLERLSLTQLREAVLTGAVQRLRPKLLTEATTLLGLAPMLWATGVGAEVIRPMAAPVLGGILVADEVIDLLLPIVFYLVRKRRLEQLGPVPGATIPFVESLPPGAAASGDAVEMRPASLDIP